MNDIRAWAANSGAAKLMDRNHLVQHTSADGVAAFGVAPSGDVSMSSLGADIAARFTKLKLRHLERGARDTQASSALSPAFHGSFGWHDSTRSRLVFHLHEFGASKLHRCRIIRPSFARFS